MNCTVPGELFANSTAPSLLSGTTTRFGTVLPVVQLRFDVSGIASPSG